MLAYLTENWDSLLVTATGVVSGASVILVAVSKFTKNTTDDRWAARLKKVLAWLSLNVKNP